MSDGPLAALELAVERLEDASAQTARALLAAARVPGLDAREAFALALRAQRAGAPAIAAGNALAGSLLRRD